MYNALHHHFLSPCAFFSPSYPINSTRFAGLIILKEIMPKGGIRLNMGNLKQLKTGFQQFTFYLALTGSDSSVYITPCKNILFDDSAFEVNDLQQIRKIEVWNYDNRKRVGTLHIERDLQQQTFEYLFKNSNLKFSFTTLSEASTSSYAYLDEKKTCSIQSRSTQPQFSSQEAQ